MADIQSLITENFDVWTSAIKKRNATGRGSSKKIELTGVKKLRELILELAVRGKLVRQDANDEPASVLLEKIEAERAQLVAEKRIKKQKLLPVISDIEKKFAIPSGWEMARLNDIIHISSGNGLTSKQMNQEGGIPVFGGNGVNGYHDDFNVNSPTLVIGRVGFYCGSIHVTPNKAWVTDNAFITNFSKDNLDLNFLAWLLKATNLNENDSATAQPVISGRKIYPIIVAIPPKNEQKLIVTKIDELLALCDQLERQTEDSISAHQTLVEVLLSTLFDNASADDFQTSWQRIADHFDVLFTTEYSIEQLKQTILQLAVMGKLVPQDSNNEPASILLERFAEEKAQLIADKKIKKINLRGSSITHNLPYELKNDWEWSTFGAISLRIIDGNYGEAYPTKTEFTDFGVPFLTSAAIGFRGEILNDKVKFISTEKHNTLKKAQSTISDILLTNRGGRAGAVALINDVKYADCNIGPQLTSIRVMSNVLLPKYVLYYMQSNVFLKMFSKSNSGSAMNFVNLSKTVEILIPIAPIKEQVSIVAKVDELMALCDQLKGRLSDAQTTQLHVADAIVEQAVN